ncbi:hypothetical protein HYC85_002342 [Camellia sinensis]|uniref:Uncharacterized protein n=1 Tax=Camellia sinensis TaxID=4442 RepID=A0A7J7I7Y5_CAMSI|nr:hypothetical protein HYC85_002342 [Camellia sinensis]
MDLVVTIHFDGLSFAYHMFEYHWFFMPCWLPAVQDLVSWFRIKSAVLNAELLQNSCLHILEVSLEEMEIFEEIKSILGENKDEDSNFIAPFPLLTKNAVESLRCRAGLSF